MVDRKKYDLVFKVLDFNKRSKSRNKFIDKSSVEDVINSDDFKSDLASGLELGLITHADRYNQPNFKNIPYCDNMAVSKYLANVTCDMQIEGDSLVAGVNLLDTEMGNRVKTLIKSGSPISVSLATNAVQDSDKFYIKKIYGVDFTLSPDLDTAQLAVNFSTDDVDTSFDKDFVRLNSYEDKLINFSTIDDLVRENRWPVSQVLTMRIADVIRFCQSKKQSIIDSNSKVLREYIENYVLNFIMDQIKDKNPVNLLLALRLNRYATDRKPFIELQQAFRILIRQLNTTGSMDKMIQKALNKNYKLVMDQIFEYINKKLEKYNKVLTYK